MAYHLKTYFNGFFSDNFVMSSNTPCEKKTPIKNIFIRTFIFKEKICHDHKYFLPYFLAIQI